MMMLAWTVAASSLFNQSFCNARERDQFLTGEWIRRPPRQSLLLRIADRRLDNSLTAGIDVTDAFGEPGEPLALQIELLPQTFGEPFFVSITGIPAQFAVSQGVHTRTDWLFTMKELKGLTITAPESFSGRFAIDVKLFNSEHKLVAAATAFVTIRKRKVAAANAGAGITANKAQTRPAAQVQLAPEIPGSTNLLTPQEEDLQLKRSEMLLKSGDISAARLILETLSDEGSGQAAYALGMTYDPSFFRSNFIRGMAAEPGKATFWYKKAFELGYKEAGSAILRLETNN